MTTATRAGFAGLDRFLREEFVEAGKLPGTLLQVWHRDALVHSSSSGFADVEQQRPMHEDAIFRIYSMTKPIMAVALLRLVEEGRLGLHDEVVRWIPAWANLRVLEDGNLVPPHRPMTVLDLARHTSGLSGMANTGVHRMYQARRIAAFDLEGGLDGLIALLADLPLEYHPGERTTYSIGATVLGYVMQQAAGMPLAEILRTRVFAPLSMDDTGFVCLTQEAGRLAACYRMRSGGSGYDRDFAHDFTQAPVLYSGDGGLVSTAPDYMRFCRMLLGGGAIEGVRLLNPASFERLSSNQLPGNADLPSMAGDNRFAAWSADGVGISICTGTTADPARRGIPAHHGDMFWFGAAATWMLVDPAEDLAIVFLTQMLDASFMFDLHRDLQRRVYETVESG
jgi:CubicO group peptidase (beta-lactamase class C family)